MLIIVSPSKRLDLTDKQPNGKTMPKFHKKSFELINVLKSKNRQDIKDLMKLSDKLTELNYERYHAYSDKFGTKNSKAAMYAFQGDVFQGLAPSDFGEKEVEFAEDHFRILSGLYGLLKPMDKMQAYRLEMGTRLHNQHGTNLYHFWGDQITDELNKTLKSMANPYLVNLASNEYYEVVNKNKINYPIINFTFKEYRDGKLKFISFNAKKARGLMSRYIIKNKILDKEGLKGFDLEDYTYESDLSNDKEYVYVR